MDISQERYIDKNMQNQRKTSRQQTHQLALMHRK